MEVEENVPLAGLTTLGVGGPARRLVHTRSSDELVAALTEADDRGEPVLLLAGGSNVVLPDAGWPGTAVHVDSRGVAEDGDVVTVAAGEPWEPLVARMVAEGRAGWEALSGIPGSTGATPLQNVGAYGQEVAQTLRSVRVWDRRERAERVLTREQCAFSYRGSALKGQERLVVLDVTFDLPRSEHGAPLAYAELARAVGSGVGARVAVGEVRAAVLALRRAKGMVLDSADPDTRSAGSFFTNPVVSQDELATVEARAGMAPPRYPAHNGRVKTSAAWLIERAGFHRGYGHGAAALSSKHTLALTNRGGATAAELLALAREIRDGVRDRFGIELRNEPVIVGDEL